MQPFLNFGRFAAFLARAIHAIAFSASPNLFPWKFVYTITNSGAKQMIMGWTLHPLLGHWRKPSIAVVFKKINARGAKLPSRRDLRWRLQRASVPRDERQSLLIFLESSTHALRQGTIKARPRKLFNFSFGFFDPVYIFINRDIMYSYSIVS